MRGGGTYFTEPFLPAPVVESAPVSAVCPACRAPGLRMSTHKHEVAYFGECLETILLCSACGFRHVDFLVLAQKDPTRHTFAIRGVDDLAVRVVRSNSGTIRVPELGFTAEPTSRSEAFVSNVQGILDRVRDVLLTARTVYHDDDTSVKIVDERLEMIAEIEAGERAATLILDDPLGNSAVVSERTEVRPLTEEELADLHTGLIVFDKSEVERGGPGSVVSG